MPSKPQAFLLIIVVVGAVFGLSHVDFTRNVPWLPPELSAHLEGVPMPARPGGTGGGGTAEKAPSPGFSEELPDDDEEEEFRITDLSLTRVSSSVAKELKDPGDASLAVLKIGPEGELRWGGLNAGSYDQVASLCRQNARDTFQLIITPDEKTPWQYVYWAIEVAGEAGLNNVSIGVNPGTDSEGTLLAMIPTPLPKDEVSLPEDMEEIEIVTIVDGDKTSYTVFDQPAKDRQELFAKISSIGGDYADEFGKEYSDRPENTPWVIVAAAGSVPAGKVIGAIAAARFATVRTVRFGGEYPPRPGK